MSDHKGHPDLVLPLSPRGRREVAIWVEPRSEGMKGWRLRLRMEGRAFIGTPRMTYFQGDSRAEAIEALKHDDRKRHQIRAVYRTWAREALSYAREVRRHADSLSAGDQAEPTVAQCRAAIAQAHGGAMDAFLQFLAPALARRGLQCSERSLRIVEKIPESAGTPLPEAGTGSHCVW